VVEQVAIGASLAPDYNTFVREHIFAPLGVSPLGGSHYLRDFDGEMEPPLGALPSDFRGNSWESLPHYSVPDYPNGFWRSSSQTYAALLGMVANRGEWGGVRLLTEASIAYLEERAPAPNNGGRQGKAFFRYDNPESRVIGHDGGELGIATGAYLDLETLVGATVLTNGDWGQGSAFSDAIERIIVHLLEEFAPEGTTVSALPRLSEGADASRRIARSAAAAAAFPSR
jgi:CubicO group peptidase (beta-lactamase class C family)